MLKGKNQDILPIVADLFAAGLGLLFVPWFAAALQPRNTGAGLILAAAFILYSIAVHLLKKLKLQPNGHDWASLQPWLSEERRRILAFFFSLFMAWALVEQSGFFRTIQQVELGDTGLSYYLLLGPLLWVVLAFMYMFVLSAPTDTTLEPGGDAILTFLALLGTNVMMSVLAGYIAAAPYLDAVSPLLQTLVVALLFGFLFAPPRLLYFFKNRTQPTFLITYLLLVVVNALLAGY